ncbi:MAG: excinuclease ABC subunit UvrC [Deltaproteobacteria bacterium]|nr:excinuclease ABC subunit UvrC [Deltaproteobacteria bacterium]
MSDNTEPTNVQQPLDELLANLPALPGVYLMKGESGTILYVGKAKNLKARVTSYFRSGHNDRGPRIQLLVSRIRDIETLITDSEKEALILENTLIKKHRPRFNVDLRDDKNYLYLKFNLSEAFPRLTLVRKVTRDKGLYFGPYTSAKGVRETRRLLHRYFPLRRCRSDRAGGRPCLYYQIGTCSCGDITDPEEYKSVVRDVKLFLEGRDRGLPADLKARMQAASEKLEFEHAARLRDQLRYLEGVLEKQKTISLDFEDRDIVGWFREGTGPVTVMVLFVRGGRLVGRQGFYLRRTDLTDEETLGSFLVQFYSEEKLVPKELLLPFSTNDESLLEQVLGERRGAKVRVLVPARGDKKALVSMAEANARTYHEEKRKERGSADEMFEEAQRRLKLKNAPRLVECFDISNLQGRQAVGSKVLFRDGVPDKNGYRRYRVRTVEGIDDYGMMYEVLKRRFERGIEEEDLPDLLVVDGGKGQLNVALRVFKDLGVDRVDAVGMAKIHAEKGEAQSYERFFLPLRKDPVRLPDHSELLLLFQRLRDEAHRFAVTYHRRLKRKKNIRSALEDIPGIGGKTAQKLLSEFGDMEALRRATLEDLVRATDKRKAAAVKSYFDSLDAKG